MAGEWTEDLHPRDRGKFAAKSGESASRKAARAKAAAPKPGTKAALLDKNRTDRTVVTYRGVTALETFSGLKAGDVFVDKAFVSTTISQKVVGDFDSKVGYLFRITSPKGTKIAAVQTVRPGEQEMLLARGSQFRVDSRSTDTRGRQILHVTVVGQ
jgi:ADP-ribosyltransferase exoenzyme